MKGIKTGGRQKGTPNKSTEELRKYAEKIQVMTPGEFLLHVMKGDLRDFGYVFSEDEIYNPEEPNDDNLILDKAVGKLLPKHLIPLGIRIAVAESLLPHFEAKRKAIEIIGESNEEPPKFIINLQPKGDG